MALPTNGRVVLETTAGDIDIELWSKEAPKACRNFIALALEGYYDGVLFHRIVPGFLVQTGDRTGTGAGGESVYGEPFEDEIHPRLRFAHRGLVAMANNGTKHSQRLPLHGKHTLFGRCVGDTVYNVVKIGDMEIDKTGRPVYPPKILRARVPDNPFPDIIPRITAAEKRAQARARAQAQREREEEGRRRGAKKNVKLLSFANDEGDGEEEGEGVFRKKAVVRPDLLPAEPVVPVPDFDVSTKPSGDTPAVKPSGDTPAVRRTGDASASKPSSDEPMSANIHAEPMSANIHAEPMSANIHAEPMSANIHAEPTSANEPTMDASAGKKKSKKPPADPDDIASIRARHAQEQSATLSARAAEIARMEADIAKLSRKRDGPTSDDEDDARSKKKRSYLAEELAKYAKGRGGRGGMGRGNSKNTTQDGTKGKRRDESDVLAALESFRGRLQGARPVVGEGEGAGDNRTLGDGALDGGGPRPAGDGDGAGDGDTASDPTSLALQETSTPQDPLIETDTDLDFLTHELRFPKDDGAEGVKAERDYEVIDPRARGAQAKAEERERKNRGMKASGRGGGGGGRGRR
ncbi:hypothetical protein BD626DRAFT_560141 [Schizophyllum amplum]|uniref:PPIase cyclophilin-type domain-containing protein n=1 Tax=Schizophyllum amplum TaxID=97359 RepID=A0A550BZW7_9AGAR|nr:hypothetical protein BD626DRAFT_560141 [Auriculariopsis ampla]